MQQMVSSECMRSKSTDVGEWDCLSNALTAHALLLTRPGRDGAKPNQVADAAAADGGTLPLTVRLGPHLVLRLRACHVATAACFASSASSISCTALCIYSLISPVKSLLGGIDAATRLNMPQALALLCDDGFPRVCFTSCMYSSSRSSGRFKPYSQHNRTASNCCWSAQHSVQVLPDLSRCKWWHCYWLCFWGLFMASCNIVKLKDGRDQRLLTHLMQELLCCLYGLCLIDAVRPWCIPTVAQDAGKHLHCTGCMFWC
eukprot:GHUV01031408.1.p1 GENE.GHUV01031408.1~~GHUV01031408.1.p1  ORF type:complete len:258 (-),score=43.86 GHUV01031408.1:2656-3429(-)